MQRVQKRVLGSPRELPLVNPSLAVRRLVSRVAKLKANRRNFILAQLLQHAQRPGLRRVRFLVRCWQ